MSDPLEHLRRHDRALLPALHDGRGTIHRAGYPGSSLSAAKRRLNGHNSRVLYRLTRARIRGGPGRYRR